MVELQIDMRSHSPQVTLWGRSLTYKRSSPAL
jgi:hypothetical protein